MSTTVRQYQINDILIGPTLFLYLINVVFLSLGILTAFWHGVGVSTLIYIS